MPLIIKVTTMVMLIAMTGCNQDEQPAKDVNTVGSDLLKTQRDALEQSKQVEQVLQDAATQQRQNIEQETQ